MQNPADKKYEQWRDATLDKSKPAADQDVSFRRWRNTLLESAVSAAIQQSFQSQEPK